MTDMSSIVVNDIKSRLRYFHPNSNTQIYPTRWKSWLPISRRMSYAMSWLATEYALCQGMGLRGKRTETSTLIQSEDRDGPLS